LLLLAQALLEAAEGRRPEADLVAFACRVLFGRLIDCEINLVKQQTVAKEGTGGATAADDDFKVGRHFSSGPKLRVYLKEWLYEILGEEKLALKYYNVVLRLGLESKLCLDVLKRVVPEADPRAIFSLSIASGARITLRRSEAAQARSHVGPPDVGEGIEWSWNWV
jgi:hypothetical protein